MLKGANKKQSIYKIVKPRFSGAFSVSPIKISSKFPKDVDKSVFACYIIYDSRTTTAVATIDKVTTDEVVSGPEEIYK